MLPAYFYVRVVKIPCFLLRKLCLFFASRQKPDSPYSMGSGCFMASKVAEDVVPDVDEDVASLTPTESLQSRTFSMLSFNSAHSTHAPPSHHALIVMEEEFGPDWRRRVR